MSHTGNEAVCIGISLHVRCIYVCIYIMSNSRTRVFVPHCHLVASSRRLPLTSAMIPFSESTDHFLCQNTSPPPELHNSNPRVWPIPWNESNMQCFCHRAPSWRSSFPVRVSLTSEAKETDRYVPVGTCVPVWVFVRVRVRRRWRLSLTKGEEVSSMRLTSS